MLEGIFMSLVIEWAQSTVSLHHVALCSQWSCLWLSFCMQVAPYELLRSLKSQAVQPAVLEVGGVKVTVEMQ